MRAATYTVHVVLRTGIVQRLTVKATNTASAQLAARNAAVSTFPCRWLSFSVREA